MCGPVWYRPYTMKIALAVRKSERQARRSLAHLGGGVWEYAPLKSNNTDCYINCLTVIGSLPSHIQVL